MLFCVIFVAFIGTTLISFNIICINNDNRKRSKTKKKQNEMNRGFIFAYLN